MNTKTTATTEITKRLARGGFTVTSVQVATSDGRAWAIDAQSTGGFRLFEIDPNDRRGPEEHDAVEGDHWDAGDLIDYLKAVGQPKAPPTSPPNPELPTP